MEGLPSHVREANACGLPDGARSGQLLTNQDLEGRGHTCAVGTNDRDAGDLRHGPQVPLLPVLSAKMQVRQSVGVALIEQVWWVAVPKDGGMNLHQGVHLDDKLTSGAWHQYRKSTGSRRECRHVLAHGR